MSDMNADDLRNIAIGVLKKKMDLTYKRLVHKYHLDNLLPDLLAKCEDKSKTGEFSLTLRKEDLYELFGNVHISDKYTLQVALIRELKKRKFRVIEISKNSSDEMYEINWRSPLLEDCDTI